MNEEVVIYTLNDPETNEVKYVGKTTHRQFRKRYIAHINSPNKKGDTNWDKKKWVYSLRKKGLKPLMEVIDVINGS